MESNLSKHNLHAEPRLPLDPGSEGGDQTTPSQSRGTTTIPAYPGDAPEEKEQLDTKYEAKKPLSDYRKAALPIERPQKPKVKARYEEYSPRGDDLERRRMGDPRKQLFSVDEPEAREDSEADYRLPVGYTFIARPWALGSVEAHPETNSVIELVLRRVLTHIALITPLIVQLIMTSKTMNFYACGLQKDTAVMLVFEPPKTDKLFRDQFPVVWKVITFRAKGNAKAMVKYVNRLAFGYAQIDQDNLVDAAAWVEVKSGDICRITGGPGQKRFGEVTRGNNTRLLVCKNSTDNRVSLSVGFISGDGPNQRYEPTLVWTGVGSKSNVSAQFTPTVTAYVTRDYKSSEMLRGEVETSAIWTCNINEIDDVTGWNFIEDDANGGFSIEPASRV
ncbi:hypothetical protein CTheo_4222 [Ceratobasidium theobromae]|uniref:Uncharacterized protein n=1 Tax=Ceratobasidium theobromae TaxID=1582974 RepID=A0A5N5QLG4_9AGAM|nr:hypothetical protein CTheo_4222 [Ceratobasidium theobromae]